MSFCSADFEFVYKSLAKVKVFELMILPRRDTWRIFDYVLAEQKSCIFAVLPIKTHVKKIMVEADSQTPALRL